MKRERRRLRGRGIIFLQVMCAKNYRATRVIRASENSLQIHVSE